MEDLYTRTRALIGDAGTDKLAASTVAVFGLGGVGSYVFEALVRAGVGRFVIVDSDVVSPSNLNRQLIATADTVGQKKTEVAATRAKSINPSVTVDSYDIYYSPDTADKIPLDGISYVADAIDSVSSKMELIRRSREACVPIISCMGTGNKLNPSMFEIADIHETSVCPLAREIRRLCRRDGIDKLTVLYSKEEPIKQTDVPCGTRPFPASISFVPSVAGLIIAGKIVRDIIGL